MDSSCWSQTPRETCEKPRKLGFLSQEYCLPLCAHARPTKTPAAQGSWGPEAPSQSPGGDLPSPRPSCGFVSRSPPPCPPPKLSLTLLPREGRGALTEPAGGPQWAWAPPVGLIELCLIKLKHWVINLLSGNWKQSPGDWNPYCKNKFSLWT